MIEYSKRCYVVNFAEVDIIWYLYDVTDVENSGANRLNTLYDVTDVQNSGADISYFWCSRSLKFLRTQHLI